MRVSNFKINLVHRAQGNPKFIISAMRAYIALAARYRFKCFSRSEPPETAIERRLAL